VSEADPSSRPASAAPSRPAGAPGLFWALTLGCAVAAGVASWKIGEENYHHFTFKIVTPPNFKSFSQAEKMDFMVVEEQRLNPPTQTKNAALAFGVLGGLLGAGLGLAGGLAGGSLARAAVAAIAGLFFGAGAGAGVSFAMVPVFYRMLDPQASPLTPGLTHGAIWVAIGAAAGLALGLGLGGGARAARGLIGGALGAALATALYEFTIALAFATERSEDPIAAGSVPRMVAHLSVAVAVALMAALVISQLGAPKRRSPHPMEA
jgi:hypothetical protein